MTRVNLIPPSELHRLHLVAEYREIPRIMKDAWILPRYPASYGFGTGHMKFFYNKLLFILRRHRALVEEMERRGYQAEYQHLCELLLQKPVELWNDWVPSQEEVDMSRARISQRLIEMGVGQNDTATRRDPEGATA